jgi:type IX secretion system protein PorZ/two component regulator with propeller domain
MMLFCVRKPMKRIVSLIIIIPLVFSCTNLFSQNALKAFQWSDHLPYNQAYSVTHQGNKIYAVANECIFSFNEDDNSYQRYNKVTGLSDIEPAIVKNNPYNNALIILYQNSNIDIIKNGNITNVPDILNKSNIGSKTINSVTFKGSLAYLACAFGIVVYDMDALQVVDTYIIGSGASYINVYQIAISPTYIYAATSKGIYYASVNSSNLASYTNWTQVSQLSQPNGVYNGVVYFGSNIIASYSGNLSTGGSAGSNTNSDTLYQFNGTSWNKNLFNTVDGIVRISVSDNKFIVIDNHGFSSYDTLGNGISLEWGFPELPYAAYGTTADAIPDPIQPSWFWEANSLYGLLKCNTTSKKPAQYQINGPTSAGCAQIQIKDGKVIVAPSFLGYKQAPAYLSLGVFSFINGTWTMDIHTPPYNIKDIDCIAFDNSDNTHFYAGSFGNGIVEVGNDSVATIYDCTNSVIPHRNFTGNTQTYVSSLYSDINNNLWIATNDNPTFIAIKKNTTPITWAQLDFSNLVPGIQYLNTNQILVDSSNLMFVIAYGTGVFIYKNDGNFTQPNSSNSKLLTNVAGNGGLPSLYPICMAEDKTGDLWVGTDQGIYVFYNPGSILTQASGWDAQPIYVTQNGQTQLLLHTDNVTSIFVDGANNKWIGTATSGLFLFSPDGQTQIYNFNTQNSPIFSNNIIDVKVNPTTGEVIIATDKGLQSFQNTTTEGNTSFEDVYAYPNPVKPGYSGPILIHGMISGADVKIIDSGGNFVYETTSEGGQASWNGQNFKGQRVASGIYMVICETPDGSQKKMTKILLLN